MDKGQASGEIREEHPVPSEYAMSVHHAIEGIVTCERDIRPSILPLPELIRPGQSACIEVTERRVLDPALDPRRRPVIQCNLEQHDLNPDCNHSLYQQRDIVVSAEPIEYPIAKVLTANAE